MATLYAIIAVSIAVPTILIVALPRRIGFAAALLLATLVVCLWLDHRMGEPPNGFVDLLVEPMLTSVALGIIAGSMAKVAQRRYRRSREGGGRRR